MRSASGDKINGNLHRHRSACVDGHGSKRVCLQSVTANTDPSLTLESAAIAIVSWLARMYKLRCFSCRPPLRTVSRFFGSLYSQLGANAAGITDIGMLFFDIVHGGHTAFL